MLTVWVTGRAATGKTTVIEHLTATLRDQGCTPALISDEQELMRLVAADIDHTHHEHRECGITWRDGALFDASLRKITDRLQRLVDAGTYLTVVELARGQRSPTVNLTYARAVQILGPSPFAQNSLVFRLNSAHEQQLLRNRARGTTTPTTVMTALYQHDDPASFTTAGITVHELPQDTPARNAAEIIDSIKAYQHKM